MLFSLRSSQKARSAGLLAGITLTSLMGLLLLLQGAQILAASDGDDPIISQIVITATLPLYDPFAAAVSRDIYFDNSSAGVITANLVFSGTPPLTLTLPTAFSMPELTHTFTTSMASLVLTYPVAITQSGQPGMVYMVENGNGLTATAVISYLQDITPPVTTLLSLPPGGLVVSTTEPLIFTGTVHDDGSGVYLVQVDEGAGDWITATLENSGPLMPQTNWMYTWTVPLTESAVYTLSFRGTDNIRQVEVAQSYTITAAFPPPIADNDEYSTPKDTPLSIAAPGVLSNDDPRGRPIEAVLVSNPAHGSLTLVSSGAFVYTPTNNFVGEDHFTYRAVNSHGSDMAVVTITVTAVDESIYLPVILKPPFTASGELGFVEGPRFKGITTFNTQVPLTFANIQFTYPPQDMKIWVGNDEPSDWTPFSANPIFTVQNPVVGGQEIHVRFWHNGQEDLKSATFFYIPNGDFQDGGSGVQAHWSPQNNGLPWSVVNDRLRLGSNTYGCSNVPFPAWAGVSMTLNVPENGYVLRVEATVYTYDQLPDPAQANYDAFEVHIGSQTQRFGYTGVELLNCSTQRTIPVNANWPLPLGNQQIHLQNHSRFDNYYNTYTDVNMVWVDEE